MEQFFPYLRGENPDRSGRFYCNFSDEEMQELEDEQHDTVALIKEACAWERKRQDYWKKKGFDDDSFYDERFREEFEAAFPPQNEPAEIADFIETYIRSVEEMLGTLERLFPHKARTSTTEDDQ
ncbi:hypothetical protein HWV62_6148 [Athelia sp. TMB]|nr:hypothetical protein HWV62_6148 [Athelia sp. TMB]